MNLDDIDGALWGIAGEDGEDLETTIYRFTDKKTPINEELQCYKYHVLTFKPSREPETIEFMKAHIGDVKRFIDNHARAGYNGVMVKDGCMPKKTIKEIIKVTFRDCQLPQICLKPILAQV
jgi:hypothetical protein